MRTAAPLLDRARRRQRSTGVPEVRPCASRGFQVNAQVNYLGAKLVVDCLFRVYGLFRLHFLFRVEKKKLPAGVEH